MGLAAGPSDAGEDVVNRVAHSLDVFEVFVLDAEADGVTRMADALGRHAEVADLERLRRQVVQHAAREIPEVHRKERRGQIADEAAAKVMA